MSSAWTRTRDHLGIVPARGGSVRIPGKNLLTIGGRTLIEIAVESAVPVLGRENICVSTDDAAIATEARRLGVRVIDRPAELSTSTASAKSVAIHALEHSDPDYASFCYLQPTSPLRTVADVAACVRMFEEEDCATVVSVAESEVPPGRFWKMRDGQMTPYFEGSNPFERRQDHAKAFLPNGAVYVCDVATFRADPGPSFLQSPTHAYTMPHGRSVDIDTEFDLGLARVWMGVDDES